MQGVRLPDAVMGEPGEGWSAWKHGNCPLGSYMKVDRCGAFGLCWYIRDPKGHTSSISFEYHQVEEHEDKTITVTPSIHDKRTDDGYHGFLQRGVWT